MGKTNKLKLNKPFLDENIEETIPNLANNFDKIDTYLSQVSTNVKAFGVTGNGITDDALAIQSIIDNSLDGEVILFPNGTYIVGRTITLRSNRKYIFDGVVKQKNNANLTHIMQSHLGQINSNIFISGLKIDGNRANNTKGHGLYMFGLQFSQLENVTIENCPQTGFYFDGDVWTNPRKPSTTVYLNNCHAYSNSGYGIYISDHCEDMHVRGGDMGMNGADCVYLGSPSSSVKNATVWASMKNGIYVPHSAPSCQIFNNNIEGHAEHGVKVEASHTSIINNKIYCNSNIPANYGKYDGVFVDHPTIPVENVSILSNSIYSGLYDNVGYHRRSVSLGNHKNCTVIGNSLRYNSNGGLDSSNQLIVGLQAGDVTDFAEFIDSQTGRPANAILGNRYYDVESGKLIEYNNSYGWVHSLRIKADLDCGTVSIGGNEDVKQVIFPVRENNNYIVMITPSWSTNYFIQNKTTTGFTVNFDHPPFFDSEFDWAIIQKQ